ncbi:calcium-transporting ATPase 8, plasma membrane-type-like [Vigna umbellata]|uniref:calcium-transporting ATPase 8, plasma membrane-type-like n=1 Tax=Vigna umbellata TaxID=87088 RepID=UPI001F5FC7D0|nr:calcium-transporting ATPase 8, plasma membrane-type-like [Vigna umbellata]XP_047170705.1 calcium-transporting ATPase 8, plasma membrane-type-like [Vigna umbellata]XP_047170706.1 calcium-transporting ATPase 8, plasma membrane-type-like [Vigna umbellata]XP_047170707.1 calcium-transporting ATPase 8, plasma membrane-type-like [Vigna umbellata]
MSFSKGYPGSQTPGDIEAGSPTGCSDDFDDGDFSADPFDVTRTKNAPVQRLRRWRQAALVLNASRRFRYTLDLKKEEEKKRVLRIVIVHTRAIQAAYRFKEAGQLNGLGTIKPHLNSTGEFSIGQEQLSSISRDRDTTTLRECEGVVGLSNLLKSNLEKGIRGDDADLLIRRNAFGSNNYPRKSGRNFLSFMWDACKDLTLIILMVAAMASLALGIKSEGIQEGWYDGGSIAFAVILVILVTAISDYKQSLQFQDLNEHKRNIHLEVIRDGRRVEISIYDVVVGDVIPLNIGNQVPADGVLISGHSLAIDESSMTGESKIVEKNSNDPFLISGCKVADGNGTMLVTAVGINTEWGLLMASISEDNGEETPLQVRLNGLATLIGIVGLSVAVIVLIVLLARYFSGHTRNPDGSVQFIAGKTKVGDAIDGVIKIFTVAVTIVVVAVPEGLPLAVTLTLAYSMKKMMADKALVRRLSACETMGSATTICSDKTGTLTMNQMTVVEACIGGKITPDHTPDQLSGMLRSLLFEGVVQNTNGSVYVPESGNGIEISGSPTERAILEWGIKLGMHFDDVRSQSSVVHVFPFNSDKKRGGVAIQMTTPQTDSEIHIHWKGAAEIVLGCCTGYIDVNNQLVEMDEEKMSYFKKVIERMAADSLRCIAIAFRSFERENVPTGEELAHWSLPEDDLFLLAIIGLKDPCRPGVKDAVQLCQKAGVKVKMVTGDNVKTAKAIAVECGILDSISEATEPIIIEGKRFRALTDEGRAQIVDSILVMGRSSPNDKLLLVQALRRNGHVVAVTGDGTNDAPALHEADIGLSMGIQGTEVAKESSDIIILDDNFASVVKVVKWGRSVYANIQKFIQFQLTVNIAALAINVVAAFSTGDIPLNTVQLLWVNLIMDTLGALALATEPPTDSLMGQLPMGRREPLVSNFMWRNLLIQAIYQVSVLLILNFQGVKLLGLRNEPNRPAIKVKNSLIFNAFVFCQVFNEFNARKPYSFNIFKGVTRNYLFMGIVLITVVLQIVIIEFLGKFTKTVKLNWKLWLISVIIAFISWPLAVVGKLIPVPKAQLSNGVRTFFEKFKTTESEASHRR